MRSLLSRAPLAYAAAYMALLILFAVVFRSIATDFYHTTAAFEPSIRADREHLRDDLTTAFREQFRKAYGGNVAQSKDWRINANDLEVTELSAIDDGLEVTLHYVVWGNTSVGPNTMQARWSTKFTLPSHSARVTMFGPRGPITYVFPRVHEGDMVKLPLPLASITLSTLLATSSQNIPTGQPVVVLSAPLLTEVNAYWAAVHGFPGNSTGEWERMFYLSAATITTLGYGDVVPLTSRARVMVGFEAVLGIAVIGLFLNACAAARQQAA